MGQLTVVYGGQFGSEGKGQIVAYLAERRGIDVAVRVGGPNAGHTFLLPNGSRQVVQVLPAPAFVVKNVMCVIGAAGLIIPEVLARELREAYEYTGEPVRLRIDEHAAVIDRDHMGREAMLKGSIGSTGEGVGAATADKVMRRPEIVISSDANRSLIKKVMPKSDPIFSQVSIEPDTADLLNSGLMESDDILIEGTQGVGLSLHTSGHYPFCTSRECTPQGMLAQSGISPDNAKRVEKIMVVRTYPIRVGGNSGKLPHEITWEQLRKDTNEYVIEPEITTVTKKQRRIAKIDYAALQRAVRVTAPTSIALTFFDYWFPEIATATDPSALKSEHWNRLNEVQSKLGVPIKYLSTGFGTVIPLRVTL